jgi:hypothetical protein
MAAIWSDIKNRKNGLIDATSHSISAARKQASPPPYQNEISQYHSYFNYIER